MGVCTLVASPLMLHGSGWLSPCAPCQSSQFLNVIGPDATKVGTDYNVSVAVISDCETHVSAICPPQVAWH